MLLNTLSTSLLTIILFSTTTLAAPTRTHCRCQIVSNTVPTPAIYTPAAAHWTPVNPSPANASPSPNAFVPAPVALDVCTSLGSELERFRHTEPELYDLYMHGSGNSDAAVAQKPIPTSVLLNRKETAHAQSSEQQSRALSPENGSRIVCFSEQQTTERFSAEFQSSFLGLWALQIIVVVTVLACVAEGVHLGKNWFQYYKEVNTSASPSSPGSNNSLRLSGAEKRLLAIPTDPQVADAVCSPGAEKKLKAYEATRYFVTQGKSGRREFIAYEDDSDDEVNRPVM
ncbi:hypothetical protein DDE82_000887 [Stemphylium lycopersici]|uniref:Uncharacterized protein n=1 Tax=Stemphylium lycopersici TaxID=183478 RepID=A0A364NEC4_STELY|nr:hypothetical protein TW65_05886 [Stemphylium lycopersici]RAR10915.1 hypothetical protein DDE82_000887 [Stemphylium lycopersici]RAR15658.1 hypothetical protein DDE83_000890 [Stemphylium lycopersici]